jgi:hypothetical protein
MRFLIFNAVVGLALVNLFTGGEFPTGGFRDNLAAMHKSAEQAASDLKRKLIVTDARTPEAAAPDKIETPGYAKDVIPTVRPTKHPSAKVRPQLKLAPPPPAAPAPKNTQAAPALPKAETIAKRPVHTTDEAKALTENQAAVRSGTAKDAVAKRRDEVLANGPVRPSGTKVALKKGTQLMSARERRRQLDRLAEEMEMLYLEKVGG